VFPEAVGPYFEGWRERQLDALAEVRSAFAPVPVLPAPFFGEEVVGEAMLDRLGDAVLGERDAAAVLHDRVTQALEVTERDAQLRLDLPFAERGDVTLKKIGLELVVRVDGHKRTLMLPPALADFRPTGAALEDGALRVSFDAPAAR
jgi:arsenite/tail-anchored protein-transporting ATPase